MRIAVVTPLFPIRAEPFRGQPIYLTIRELRKLASDLRVFCPQAKYPEAKWLRPRSYVYYPPDSKFSPPDVPATYFEYPALPAISRPVNGYFCYRALRKHLQAWKPDLVLSYWLYPEGYAAVLAAESLGVPSIVGARGSDLSVNLDRVTRFMTERTLRKADGAVMVSEELRQRSISFGMNSERVKTVFNGCDTSIFHPADREAARQELGISPDAELVLFVGHLNAGKGVRELFDATARLMVSRPKLQVVLIGDGGMQAELPGLASRLGIEKHVRLAGRASSPQIARWLTAADLFCLPTYAEGCPNVVIEALACGRPIVSTTVGAIPDLVDSTTGILISPRDSAALAGALKQAFAKKWDSAAISPKWNRSWATAAVETMEHCRFIASYTAPSSRGSESVPD